MRHLAKLLEPLMLRLVLIVALLGLGWPGPIAAAPGICVGPVCADAL